MWTSFPSHLRAASTVGLLVLAPAAHSQTSGIHETVTGLLATRADSAMRRLTAAGFSGVVLVAKDGEIILEKGYGLADRAAGIPMSPSSIVQIGSSTKDFTIVAVLQLMERGKLALTDSITKYFTNVPADKRGVTINHLLKHQAGFAQHMGPDFDAVTRDQEIARALSASLHFAPGTAREYSNIGYSLLAAIIEMASGKSYDEYVRDNILQPLDLHDTGLLLPRFEKARVARGYHDGKDQGTFLERPHAADGPYWNLRGNGGMLSTVGDMYRFYRSLFGDAPLVKRASRDLFFRPDEPIVLAGSDLTWFFFYSRYPRAGLDVILVSNSTDFPAPKARSELSAALGIAEGGGENAGGRGNRIVADAGPARTTLPDTPAGRAARIFLEMNSTGADSAIRRYLDRDVLKRPDDQRSLDQRVAAFKERREETGALTLVRIDAATDYEITFAARSRSDEILTITITVESSMPFRTTGIRITA